MAAGKLMVLTAALLVGAGAARADVSISSKPTQNMNCESGVCTATASKAVLNAGDLQTLLTGGDVAVKTGTLTKDIAIDQPLTWSSTSRLTLDAQQSVTLKKQVTVAGSGALTITTNDGGKHGEFMIVPEHGSVQFWDAASSLIIDGNSYTLVNDIKTLASDIAANPSGFYALAKPYDASVDGTYMGAPIGTTLTGRLDGLGNAVSNLTIQIPETGFGGALINWVGATGKVRDIGILNADLHIDTCCAMPGGVAALATRNDGLIADSWATGSIHIRGGGGDTEAGGLVSRNIGRISGSFARVKIQLRANESEGGGLVAENYGSISRSYAAGSVKGNKGDISGDFGGLVAYNAGTISNAYSTTSVNQAPGCCDGLGGLIGMNDQGGQITAAYASGEMTLNTGGRPPGGLIGDDQSAAGDLNDAYWNLDDGIGDPGQGAGNLRNDPGITGLTTQQLQAGLPAGFDPKVWAQSALQNNGLPYLRDLPTK